MNINRRKPVTMNVFRYCHPMLFCLLIGMTAVPAQAGAPQSLEEIRQAAERFIRQQVQLPEGEHLRVQTRQLDRRLRLTACPTELAVSLPAGFQIRSRTSVQVQCASADEPWKLFVPLHLQRQTLAWSAAVTLPRGRILQREDLRQAEVVLDLNTPLAPLAELVGKRLKQAVAAGQAIQPQWLEAPLGIRRGERVTLVSGSGRVQVRMTGIVMQDARLGEKVKVRNLSSGKHLEGWLTSNGEVQVGGPPPARVAGAARP